MLRTLVAAVFAAMTFCGQPSSFAADVLLVGVGVAEITPPQGYSMSGYFYDRGASGVLDPLYAKAIVFKQGQQSAAIVVGDIIGINRQLGDLIRDKVSQETGIPVAHIAVTATHSHTGPNYSRELARYLARDAGASKDGKSTPYIPILIEQFTDAVMQASKSAQPAELHVGLGEESTVAFNRRFILKDGTVRTWAKLDQPDVVKAAGPTDPELKVLTVTYANQPQPAAALISFSLHCDTVEKENKEKFSADYPGHIQRVLRKELGSDLTSVFATAPCGDINHSDPSGQTRRTAAEIGELIGIAAAKVFPNVEPVVPSLAVRQAMIQVPLQDYTAEDLEWARALQKRRDAGEKITSTIAAKGSKILRLERLRTGREDYGRDTLPTDPDRPAITEMPAEVQAIRLGSNVAIVTLPGEIFVELGLAIKQASPFQHTIVVELANDSPAYVPTRKAMEQGGYEPNNSIYATGGGELLVDTAIRLLKELKPTE